jgi:hypothetical protein
MCRNIDLWFLLFYCLLSKFFSAIFTFLLVFYCLFSFCRIGFLSYFAFLLFFDIVLFMFLHVILYLAYPNCLEIKVLVAISYQILYRFIQNKFDTSTNHCLKRASVFDVPASATESETFRTITSFSTYWNGKAAEAAETVPFLSDGFQLVEGGSKL